MLPSELTLVPVSLAQVLSKDGNRSAKDFFDFVIDGISLREVLKTDDVAVLSDQWDSSDFARQLLSEASGDQRLEGRAQIYGCRECLDIECGGIAVSVTRVGDRVRWETFAKFWPDYEYDRFTFEPVLAGRYEFDLSQYRGTLQRFIG
ncbi:MAG TPA: hypothetical protein VFO29_01885 [Candidatus Rubrimentiphilum sp.]|nr:hypothetical protein [Candidatus Rubrimentiphilum sp.]